MSKSDGLKIGIRFTEDIVGDISGNESAFTITGQEYQYVNGPLIDGNYLVDKVERYPIQRVWELGDTLELDNVGEVIEIVGWNTNSFGLGNPATGTRGYKFKPINNCLVTKLRIFATETTSTVHLWDVLTQTILVSKTFTTTAGRWNEVVLDEPIQIYNNKEYIVSANYTSGNDYYRNSNPLQSEFNELTILGFFTSTSHNTFPTSSNTWGNAVDIVMQIGDIEFETPKIYLSEVIQLSGEYRIRWLENKSGNTDVLIEYTTGETQGQWQTVSNGEVINIDTNLWIRATLSTTDTTATPILQELWIEEASAPQDKILITMDWWGRFNNVEDKIKVLYDASKGSLTGAGGAVESFEVEFTPQDLVQTPNPNEEELIKAYPYEVVLDLNELEFKSIYAKPADNLIQAYPYEIVLTLTDIDEINP